MNQQQNLQKRYSEYKRLCSVANAAYISFITWYKQCWVLEITGIDHCLLCGVKKTLFESSYIKTSEDLYYCSKEHYVDGMCDDNCIKITRAANNGKALRMRRVQLQIDQHKEYLEKVIRQRKKKDNEGQFIAKIERITISISKLENDLQNIVKN